MHDYFCTSEVMETKNTNLHFIPQRHSRNQARRAWFLVNNKECKNDIVNMRFCFIDFLIFLKLQLCANPNVHGVHCANKDSLWLINNDFDNVSANYAEKKKQDSLLEKTLTYNTIFLNKKSYSSRTFSYHIHPNIKLYIPSTTTTAINNENFLLRTAI